MHDRLSAALRPDFFRAQGEAHRRHREEVADRRGEGAPDHDRHSADRHAGRGERGPRNDDALEARAPLVALLPPGKDRQIELLDPEGRDIPDPIGHPREFYEETLGIIDEAVDKVSKII